MRLDLYTPSRPLTPSSDRALVLALTRRCASLSQACRPRPWSPCASSLSSRTPRRLLPPRRLRRTRRQTRRPGVRARCPPRLGVDLPSHPPTRRASTCGRCTTRAPSSARGASRAGARSRRQARRHSPSASIANEGGPSCRHDDHDETAHTWRCAVGRGGRGQARAGVALRVSNKMRIRGGWRGRRGRGRVGLVCAGVQVEVRRRHGMCACGVGCVAHYGRDV